MSNAPATPPIMPGVHPGVPIMPGVPNEPPPFPPNGITPGVAPGGSAPGGSAKVPQPPNRQTKPNQPNQPNRTGHGKGTANANACPFVIVVDTREQTPLTFPGTIPTIRAGLRTGDYSIKGHEDHFTVERKSLADLVHTLIHERERFVRELERMQPFAFKRVICTASMDAVRRGNYQHSRANPNAVVATIATFEVRYHVPFVFAGSTDEAARRIVDWAQYFTRECALRDHERMLAGRSGGTPLPPGIGSSKGVCALHPNTSGDKHGAIPAIFAKRCQKVPNENAPRCQPLPTADKCQNKRKDKPNHAAIP